MLVRTALPQEVAYLAVHPYYLSLGSQDVSQNGVAPGRRALAVLLLIR